jgi:hypothetical protein
MSHDVSVVRNTTYVLTVLCLVLLGILAFTVTDARNFQQETCTLRASTQELRTTQAKEFRRLADLFSASAQDTEQAKTLRDSLENLARSSEKVRNVSQGLRSCS